MKNQNGSGSLIVISLMVLVLLTLMGTASIKQSNTELAIATNFAIYQKNFYTAESGISIAPLWIKSNLDPADYTDVDYFGTFNDPHFGSKGLNSFSVDVEHITAVDPVDGETKVLLYGDPDGDYLNEINFEDGVPFEEVTSTGSHVRGGETMITATFQFEPIFMMPDAALRVNSSVDGNGVSGSVVGEHISGSSCADVADIMYDVAGGTIEYGGDLGLTPRIEESTGMYPMSLLIPVIEKNATQTIIGSNNIDEAVIITSAENPGVIVLKGDSKATNLVGFGILLVDGNFEMAGNLSWTGLILVNGNIVFSGGGTKVIHGAVIGAGEAVALNGSVDIQYDCDALSSLYDEFSNYRMLTWKQN
jgi:hypothetical protein